MEATERPLCGARVLYSSKVYDCSLPTGHTGPCRTWVEEADLEEETDLSYQREERWS